MRKALGDKSAGLGRWRMWAAPAVAVAIVLLLIGAGGYALLRHMVEQGVHQAELKWEEERRAIELEANRKVEEAEQQRLAALNAAAQERQARAAAEAEAKRKATEAEQQRLAALKAEQERQARFAAEAEAKRKPEEAERQRLAAAKAEQERQARAAAEAEAKRKAEEAEQQRVAAAPKTPPSPPEFPWPPPAASASYVLPKNLFENRRTIGEVVAAIISALERNGYVERSFFRIEAGGVALVTRLERIRDDGSSFVESRRWPAAGQGNNLSGFLRGLFFVEPGHYRVIVFILRDLPFSQSSQIVTRDEVRGWLHSGANTLAPEIAKESFGDGNCTVLVYEFASDGRAVRVVESRLTGKEHLSKAGLLSLLAKD